jgi:hypothetical protein
VITVRASTLDSFRLYMDPDCEFISTEEMEARLRRGQDDEDAAPSEAAALGKAFNEAINGTYDGPIVFDLASLAEAGVGTEDALPEVAGSVVLDVDGVLVRVTGHADWLLGLDMLELKTSEKPIAPDKYLDSMQWRAYVLIFGVERVTYRQVQLEESKTDGSYFARKLEDVVVGYAYPRMREDVTACLRALLDFARVRGCLDAMDTESEAA